ncbi:unnamed protein product, partial [Iphiclides podalirius]
MDDPLCSCVVNNIDISAHVSISGEIAINNRCLSEYCQPVTDLYKVLSVLVAAAFAAESETAKPSPFQFSTTTPRYNFASSTASFGAYNPNQFYSGNRYNNFGRYTTLGYNTPGRYNPGAYNAGAGDRGSAGGSYVAEKTESVSPLAAVSSATASPVVSVTILPESSPSPSILLSPSSSAPLSDTPAPTPSVAPLAPTTQTPLPSPTEAPSSSVSETLSPYPTEASSAAPSAAPTVAPTASPFPSTLLFSSTTSPAPSAAPSLAPLFVPSPSPSYVYRPAKPQAVSDPLNDGV